MNTLFTCSLLLIGQISSPETLEFDPYAPIELRAEIEVPEEFEILMYDWEADKPVFLREYDDGKAAHVWAPPGKYEIELEVFLINWEAKIPKKIEQHFSILIRGPPVVVTPDDPVIPVDPTYPIEGPVQVIVIEDSPNLTVAQSGALLELSDWADETDDVHIFRFSKDADLNVAKQYISRVHGQLPYYFLTKKTDKGAVIITSGELKGSAELIELIKKYR